MRFYIKTYTEILTLPKIYRQRSCRKDIIFTIYPQAAPNLLYMIYTCVCKIKTSVLLTKTPLQLY